MIRVNVTFHGVVRTKARGASTEITLPDASTAVDLLHALAERFGEDFTRQVLTRDGRLQDYIRILVNDEILEPARLDTELKTAGGGSAIVGVYLLPAEIGG